MQKKKIKLEFTGERLIPELNKGKAFFYEHLARYLFASQFVKNKIVLDAGCGTGYGAYILAKYGKAKKVYAVDISQEAIDYAQSKYSNKNIQYYIDNVEELKTVSNNQIDVAVSFEVIEHIKHQEEFLKQVKKVLKPNGLFIISTPNKYVYPDGNPFHVKEFYPEEFKKLLNSYFKNIKLYHQTFEFSQMIKETEGNFFNFEESFVITNQELYTSPANYKTSQYLVAICSDKILPNIRTLSISSTKVDNFDLSKGFFSLNEQFNNLYNQINFLNSQKETLLKQIQNLESQLQETKNQNKQIMSLIESVKNEIEQKNKEIEELKTKLKKSEKKEKEEELRLIKENQDLQTQIHNTRAHIQNLETTLNIIKSAKFFKLWQTYCKIKKFLNK